MPYKYVAYTADKRVVEGTLDCTSESLAEESLESAGYGILSLKFVRPRPSLEQLFPTFFGVKPREVIAFSRHLAAFVDSGIPLTDALKLLEEQALSAPFRRVIAGLLEDLKAGRSFSQAVARHPQVFPEIYCQLMGAGEEAGNLDLVLRQVASYMERGTAAAQKAKRALVYPALVLLLAVGVVSLVMTAALPPLLGLFTGLGTQLPWSTRLLFALAGFLDGYKFHLLGAVLISAVFLLWYERRPAGRQALDGLLLRLPIIGSIVLESDIALFSRTLSVLLKSGLPLTQIMDIACRTAVNRVIRHSLEDVRGSMERGRNLSQAIAASQAFPRLLAQMIMVGEHTGTLDANLATMADYYDEEVSQKVTALISALEPGLTVVIGLAVGFIALSVIMPMYSIMGSLK